MRWAPRAPTSGHRLWGVDRAAEQISRAVARQNCDVASRLVWLDDAGECGDARAASRGPPGARHAIAVDWTRQNQLPMHVLAGSLMMSRMGLAGSRPMARSTQSGRGRVARWIGSLSTVALIVFIASNSRVSRADRGNEASAIGSLRAINSAHAAFASSCAAGGCVTDLADLNKKPGGSSQGFISPDLNHNDVVKSGYIVSVARDAASGVTEVSSAACVELTSRLASTPLALRYLDIRDVVRPIS